MKTWKELSLEMSIDIINIKEVPVQCDGCWFLAGSGGFFCDLLDKNLPSDGSSICTIYDHTKYLLEHV